MKCQLCGENKAEYKISLPGYKGNIAEMRCEKCKETAERSFEEVKIEKLNT